MADTKECCTAASSAVGKRKILVVDDDPDAVEIIRFFLSDAGYEVTSAVNGQDAIKKAEEIEPDLITLDIKMPVMDGLQAASALRARPETKKIPIMAISIVGDELGEKEGIDESLCKPFSGDELLSKVKKLLKGQGKDA